MNCKVSQALCVSVYFYATGAGGEKSDAEFGTLCSKVHEVRAGHLVLALTLLATARPTAIIKQVFSWTKVSKQTLGRRVSIRMQQPVGGLGSGGRMQQY